MTDATTEWMSLTVVMYGQEVAVEVVTWVGLWYKVAKDHPLRFVLVRDPKNHHRWACFFTTQSSLSALTLLQTIAGRWSLEVAFYEAKQYLGIEHAQSRLPKAVNRLFPIGMPVLSLVKFWFITPGVDTSFAKVSYAPGIVRKPNRRFPICWPLCVALGGPTDFIQPLLLPMSCIKLFSS